MADQIKRNFDDLTILRENSIFKEILLKDFERNQQLERLKFELVTGKEIEFEEKENDHEEKTHFENKLNKHLY